MFLAGMCLGALAFFVWAWRAMGEGVGSDGKRVDGETDYAAVAAKHLPMLREALAKKVRPESPDVIDARHTAELKAKAAALVQSRLAQA